MRAVPWLRPAGHVRRSGASAACADWVVLRSLHREVDVSTSDKFAGKFVTPPGWAGVGLQKIAAMYAVEALREECSDVAKFGYGHPALTKTPLTESCLNDYKDGQFIKGIGGFVC